MSLRVLSNAATTKLSHAVPVTTRSTTFLKAVTAAPGAIALRCEIPTHPR